jgi:GTPase KRas protein
MLEILDTAGQYDQYTAIRDLYMRDADGFILIYSISDRASFQYTFNLKDNIARINQVPRIFANLTAKKRAPIVLVGNKCDLTDKRQVFIQEGQEAAFSFNAPFLETSAKTPTNVTESFHAIVREIRKTRGIATLSSQTSKA